MPLHPVIVHLPIALAVLMPLITIGLLIAWWRGALQRRTWTIAIVLQALLVGSGVLAMRSGEADEDRVEAVVAHDVIHEHEEAAETFVYGAAGVLVLVLVAGLIPRERAARAVAALAATGTLAVLGLGYLTGKAGGELVYRHGAAAAFASDPGTPPAQTGHIHAEND